MIIFSTTITNRLQYIAGFIGGEIIGKALALTDNINEFTSYTGPKINYSNSTIAETELWIQPHNLLFEKNIQPQAINCFEVNGNKAFFQTSGNFSFDIFAASFYLLSRYEEYLPHEKDMYGRYAHENSVAFKENFLNIPLVNTWLKNFREVLQAKFPDFKFRAPGFLLIPTYDIDEAYSYKHKAWWRTAGAAIKDLLKGRFEKVTLRKRVLSRKTHDPYDAYEWMNELHQQYKLKPRYFFLVPEKNGKYDKNNLPTEKAVQTLIQQHAEAYQIGVHPSWQSGDDLSLIKKEKETIEKIISGKINSSRQHYIRLTLPQTFRYLIDAGITEDFSMGYGSINGFRASVASPFYWYDLEKGESTSLLLYPFCYMEANSFFEQKFSAEQALQVMRYYYKQVKAVDGLLITLWHNTFLGTDERFKGWREVYKQFVEEIN